MQHSKKLLLSILLITTAFFLTSKAQVTIEVSPRFSAISYSNSVKLSLGGEEIFELNEPPTTDSYNLIYSVRNAPLSLIVLDRQDAITNNPNPSFLINKVISQDSFLLLPKTKSRKGLIVALANESNKVAELAYVVFRIGTRSPAVVNQIKKVIEIPIKALDEFYILPKFKISILPCGTANAFSSPDIIICSELISDLFERGLSDALYPILLHEVAHSLLNLWNLPGYDNEDLADEFAATMLSRVDSSYNNAFIKYLEDSDSITEAIVQLNEGSRHTISIQRARNIRIALAKINQIEKRWETLLNPYRRKK